MEVGGRFKVIYDFDYELGPDPNQGTVETKINNVYSESINCTAKTLSPTAAPIPVPTSQPTTKMPTASPTFEDPYLFIGGDICDKDRCSCSGWELTCTGPDIYNEWRFVNVFFIFSLFSFNNNTYFVLV